MPLFKSKKKKPEDGMLRTLKETIDKLSNKLETRLKNCEALENSLKSMHDALSTSFTDVEPALKKPDLADAAAVGVETLVSKVRVPLKDLLKKCEKVNCLIIKVFYIIIMLMFCIK
jgi:uncharacterized coiled-coil DUF342 family protein